MCCVPFIFFSRHTLALSLSVFDLRKTNVLRHTAKESVHGTLFPPITKTEVLQNPFPFPLLNVPNCFYYLGGYENLLVNFSLYDII